MKTTIYEATTANGMIARKNGDMGFLSDMEWQGFMQMAYDVGNCIIGRKTFDVLLEKGKFPLNCFNVVLSKGKRDNKWPKTVAFCKSPKAALKLLAAKGFKEALVMGGGLTNTSFIKSRLADKIIVDIEPMLLADGIKLFEGKDFENKLKLEDAQKFSTDEVRLIYRVIK